MSPPSSKKGKKKASSTKEPVLSLADFLSTPATPALPRADGLRIPVPATAPASAARTAGSVANVADLEATLRGCSLQQSEIDRILSLKREAERASKDKGDANAAPSTAAATADITLVKKEDTSDDSSCSSDDSDSDSDSDCDENVGGQRQAFDHFTKYLALL